MGWQAVGVSALVVGILALSTGGAQAAPTLGAGCGSSAPSLSPGTPDEQTLVGYFEALNARNYGTAWEFFGDDIRSMYGSQQNYVALMNTHVGCVRLLGVTPYGPHTYLVNLAAQYPTPFPAGSGALPAFWTVDDGTIVEFGTGPRHDARTSTPVGRRDGRCRPRARRLRAHRGRR